MTDFAAGREPRRINQLGYGGEPCAINPFAAPSQRVAVHREWARHKAAYKFDTSLNTWKGKPLVNFEVCRHTPTPASHCILTNVPQGRGHGRPRAWTHPMQPTEPRLPHLIVMGMSEHRDILQTAPRR
jgi:hypothetical protein